MYNTRLIWYVFSIYLLNQLSVIQILTNKLLWIFYELSLSFTFCTSFSLVQLTYTRKASLYHIRWEQILSKHKLIIRSWFFTVKRKFKCFCEIHTICWCDFFGTIKYDIKQEAHGPHCSLVKQFLSIKKFSRLESPSPKDTHCDKFGWNLPISSGVEGLLMSSIHFGYYLPWNKDEQNWTSFTQECLVPSLVKLVQWLWRRRWKMWKVYI